MNYRVENIEIKNWFKNTKFHYTLILEAKIQESNTSKCIYKQLNLT